MRYLKPYRSRFPHTVRQGELTLHLDNQAAADILPPIAALIGERGTRPMRRSVAGCLAGPRSRLFVKTVEIDSLPCRLRVTLGMQRRDVGYDWPVAELINTLKAAQLGAPVAGVRGFGYRRRGRRLVRELFLVSEMLDDHVNGLHWLEQPGTCVESFLKDAFGLLLQLHGMGIHHLDLWAANIMLDPAQPHDLRVVDLENCFIGETAYAPEALGFQFGFFYFRFIKQFIDEARYDQLVAEALAAQSDIDAQRFQAAYSLYKHQTISRKKRRALVIHGRLSIKTLQP